VRQAVDAIGYLNLVIFTALAVVAVRQWQRRRSMAAVWVAAAFVLLGIVVLGGRAVGPHPDTLLDDAVVRLEIAALVLFPYLLYRFAQAFSPASRRLEILVTAMTTLLVAWTFALRHVPEEGEHQPTSFKIYVLAFVIHWSVLSAVVSWRLWRAGRGQPTVARRRMVLLSLASAAITVAIVFSAYAGDRDSIGALLSGGAGVVSGFAFLLGMSPPPLLRMLWRRPEQRRMQDAIRELMARAGSEREVAERVLPPMAQIVGANAIAWLDGSGQLIHAHNVSPELLAGLQVGEPASEADVLRLVVSQGSLVIWSTPYAPFFGDEEFELLTALAALAGIALDRARLSAQEVEARLALERASELKSNFVALAAHELRTPVTSINGVIQTLDRVADRLDVRQREELERTLVQQGARLARLVEQLLDLSRLDAAAVVIEPERLPVRERVEDLVASVAGERADDVRNDVPAELETQVDLAAFDRIVSNLVVNALRYGRPPVIVRAEQSGGRFRVFVEDRGDGVPPEFVPDLFDRFTRGQASRARAIGTGLGLAIARSFARAHDGDLTYEAANPTGACFELSLPAARPPADVDGHLLRH
jgi:signal transduction histidine kinase